MLWVPLSSPFSGAVCLLCQVCMSIVLLFGGADPLLLLLPGACALLVLRLHPWPQLVADGVDHLLDRAIYDVVDVMPHRTKGQPFVSTQCSQNATHVDRLLAALLL